MKKIQKKKSEDRLTLSISPCKICNGIVERQFNFGLQWNESLEWNIKILRSTFGVRFTNTIYWDKRVTHMIIPAFDGKHKILQA